MARDYAKKSQGGRKKAATSKRRQEPARASGGGWRWFGAGLISGVFLSFSDFVMRGLAQAPGTAGATGMIGLNRTVYKSIFMVLFMGLVLGSIALALWAYWQLDGAALSLVVAGTLSYRVGVLAVTGFGNIPVNNRLDATSERSGDMAI